MTLNGTTSNLNDGTLTLNFGDESTGITDAEANSKLSTLNSKLKKGVYIHEGKKICIILIIRRKKVVPLQPNCDEKNKTNNTNNK